MEETTTVSHKGNKLRSFTLEFQLDAISYAKTYSDRAAAKKFNVDERRIRELKQKHEDLAITQTKKGAGVQKKKKKWQMAEENLLMKTMKKKYETGFMSVVKTC